MKAQSSERSIDAAWRSDALVQGALTLFPTLAVMVWLGCAPAPEPQRPTPTGPTVGPAGGTIATSNGAAKLVFSPNAVAADTEIAIQEASVDANGWSILPGTTYTFEPNGLKFEAPVEMTIQYDPARLPAGTAENSLMLVKIVGTALEEAGNVTVDTAAKTVKGTIGGFSTYGLRSAPTEGTADPNNPIQLIANPEDYVPGKPVELTASFTKWPGDSYEYEWLLFPDDHTGELVCGLPDGSGCVSVYSHDYGAPVFWVRDQPVSKYYACVDKKDGDRTTVTVKVWRRGLQGIPFYLGKAQATFTVKLNKIEVSPNPAKCSPGGIVELLATFPHDMAETYLYEWQANGCGQFLLGDGSESSYVRDNKSSLVYHAYEAKDGFTDSVEVVVYKCQLSVPTYPYFNDEWFPYGKGQTSVIIGEQKVEQTLSSRFDPDPPMVDVNRATGWDCVTLSIITSKFKLDGTEIMAWETTGNYGGLSGPGMVLVKTLELTGKSGRSVTYQGTVAQDRAKDNVSVKIYRPSGTERQLIGQASAMVEIYAPQTWYCICGTDRFKAPDYGMNNVFDFYHWGHGAIGGECNFRARVGDTVRINAQLYGDPHGEIWLRKGRLGDDQYTILQRLLSENELPSPGEYTREFSVAID